MRPFLSPCGPFSGGELSSFKDISKYPALQRCVSSIFLGAEWDKYVENNSNLQIFERYTFEHFTKMHPPPPKKKKWLFFFST